MTMSGQATADPLPGGAGDLLVEPETLRLLWAFVAKRVPVTDTEDIVQTVLCEAVASPARPAEREPLRRWLFGIARHKVIDARRRAQRERPLELPELLAAPSPVEERAMVRWVEAQVPASEEATKTLSWMAREAEGDKLEAIATSEALPPVRVRQRVSRMRKLLRTRWQAELAALALMSALALLLWRWLRSPEGQPVARPILKEYAPPLLPSPLPPAPEPTQEEPQPPELSPREQARLLRKEAIPLCDGLEWRGCIERLDRAKKLDPAGELRPEVRAARKRALDWGMWERQLDQMKGS